MGISHHYTYSAYNLAWEENALLLTEIKEHETRLESISYLRSLDWNSQGKTNEILDRYGNLHKYSHDHLKREMSVTDQNGRRTRTTYDAYGHTTSILDPENRLTTTEYFSDNEYGNSKYGEPKVTMDWNNGITTYERDAGGNIVNR